MPYMQMIQFTFSEAFQEVLNSEGFTRFSSKQLTTTHYASFMRQTFHATRNNPQLQALAAVHFRGHQREMVKRFFQHAISEVGHDQLALNDMECLGFSSKGVHTERPLPETTALIAYPFYQIQQKNPLGYLGYLYFLEFLPTSYGETIVKTCLEIGVPQKAMTFICDHVAIDQGHNRLMEDYIEHLIKTEYDANEVCYAIRTTGKLYANMLTAALKAADSYFDYNQYGEDSSETSITELSGSDQKKQKKPHQFNEEPA